MKTTLLAVVLFSLLSSAFADELRLSASEARRLGYEPVARPALLKTTEGIPLPKNGIPWPVSFEDAAHSMGNSMAQYQEYGDGEPYWHGGNDLRTARKAWLVAPISGTLAGGHYSYVNSPDGSAVKQMRPWPKTGPALYFEISITTAEGYRLEFHHVDRNTLTKEIVAGLNKGNVQIKAGTKIGQVAEWPTEKPYGSTYYHIHYNIITPDEKELNPEWFSPLIADSTPPTVHGVYARYGVVYEKVAEGATLKRRPDELVVANTDLKDGNSYRQPADFISITHAEKEVRAWDTRLRLHTPQGTYPDIRMAFAETITVDGKVIRTQGNYSADMFLARVAMPADFFGPVSLRLLDQAGNEAVFRLNLPR